jgi:23S rRNA maturation mini-RNase III
VELPPPCDLGGAEPQARWNAVSLAYLGDAVWEVRTCSLVHQPNHNSCD